MKNNGLSDEVNVVLRYVNELKKTMRNKKSCFTECDNKKIRKAFIRTLNIDLLNLSYSLECWLESGAHITADEDDCNAD